LSSTTYCLANSSATGAEYLVYDPSSSSAIVVDLSATSGNLNVEWFNPETGMTTFSGTVAGSTNQTFTAPFSGDVVLYLSSVGNGPIPSGTFQSNITSLPSGGGIVTLNWSSVGATYADIDQGIGVVPFNGSINVVVTTTTMFSLRLINSNGTIILTTTVTVASPPAPQTNIIYTENVLTSPWNDIRSWSVTRNYANTSNVYQSSTSARIVHSSWASLQFSQGNWGSFVNIDPALYQSLDFAINGGATGFTLKVNCLNASGGSIFTPVSFAVPANSWLIKSIPMSQIASAPFISIQFTASGSNVTFYLDNISLVLKPSGPTAPSAPNLLSPFNNSINQPTSLALIWNSSSGAVSYQLQVSADSLFTTTFLNDSTITDTSRTISGLNNGSNYFWRMSARNTVGKSAFSSIRKFTTIVAPPITPQLQLPANNSVDQTMPLTFRWNVSQGATEYRLQIATDSTFATIVLNDSTLTDTTRTVSSFQSFTKYYWRVGAKNIAGQSPFSTVWTYTTSITPPNAPLLSSPNDNATGQPVNIQFSWYSVSNATSYRLQLSQDSIFTNLIHDQNSITDTTLQISPLNNLSKYFWRVSSSNSGGSSSFSSIRRLTTIAPAPMAPQLVSPTNGATNQMIVFTFRWNKSLNASSYRIQVSQDSSFTTIVMEDSILTDTNKVSSSLLYSANYFWRVRAAGVGGTSAYSTVWSFTTGTIPTVPTLLSPLNNGLNLSTSQTLKWNTASNATSYHVQISTDSLFATSFVNDSTLIDTSRAIVSLNTNTTYFWRVRSQNSVGKSSFSSNWRFTTMAPVTPTVSYIYQEGALSSPWNDIRSWSVTRNYASTNPVFQGSTSARIVHSPWAVLQFSQGTWGSFVNISPTPFQSLDFAVHGGSSGVTLKVSCQNPSGGNIFTPVSISVPANTWQNKSILMSQLANVPFVSLYITALASNVTFSLDNIGLVYKQTSPPPAKTVPKDKNVRVDFSNNGKIDGQDIAFFVDAWKRNDLGIADIGPVEGTLPNLILKKDGRINSKDFEVFQSLWKWSQTHFVDEFNERTIFDNTIDNDRDIRIVSLSTVTSLKNQIFKVQLPTFEESQTVEMIVKYDPSKTRVEDILTDSNNGLLLLKNIDNNFGTAVVIIASTSIPLSNQLLSSGLFKMAITRLSAIGDDSIQVTMRSFSEASEMTINTSKKFSLQKLYIPENYELSQNFPNPFNPFTTIRYSLPAKSRVSLEVFNSLGQSVSRLIDKEMDAGFGEVVWNGGTASGLSSKGGYASGVYFYRFEAVSSDNPSKRFTNVKKMSLLK
ncbi:MAG: putative collagen-binding domain-containing protein, partial [Bacteroidota bacterium]|nr:putative collagen-binding domain-containing protein [Bacteroidota bacterium]